MTYGKLGKNSHYYQKYEIGDRVLTYDGMTGKIINGIETDRGYIYNVEHDFPELVAKARLFSGNFGSLKYGQYFDDCLSLL